MSAQPKEPTTVPDGSFQLRKHFAQAIRAQEQLVAVLAQFCPALLNAGENLASTRKQGRGT